MDQQLHGINSALSNRFFRRLTMTGIVVWMLLAVASSVHAQGPRKTISKEFPAFPSDAMDEGISSGSVKARIHIVPDGSVARVEILESTPKGVFDRSVVRTLMRWKYEPGSAETIDTLLTFKE